MGSKDSKISTLNITQSQIQSISQYQPQEYKPNHFKFGQFYKKNKPDHNRYKITIQSPIQKQITTKIKAYKDRNEAYNDKTKDIVIQSAIFDNQINQRYVFQSTGGGQDRSVIIRTFKNVESKRFAAILYEIYINQEISKLGSQNLHKIKDKYMIPLDIETSKHSNSVVLEMERIDINLSRIISFRRLNNLEWDQKEFAKLINDVVQGLQILHKNNITHNAIRPSNIYFSSKTNEFLLGYFSNSIKRDGQGQVQPNPNPNDGQQHEQQHGNDLDEHKKKDVEDLGIALLSAFYLCEPIDVKKAQSRNQELSRKYDSLKIVLQMISPQKNRKTAEYLRSAMIISNFQYSEMKQIIKKIHAQNSQSDEVKKAIGWGYLHLGKYDQMGQSNEALTKKYELSNDSLSKADHFQHLASVQKALGKPQETKKYAKLASSNYQQVANEQFDNQNYLQAEKNYKKSLKCSSKYNNGEYDQNFKHNIQQLQKIQQINNPNDYVQIKKLSAAKSMVTSKLKGDSLETCQLKTKQALLDSQHGNFSSSERLYNQCLGILSKNNQETPEDREMIKAELLTMKGENNMRWAQTMDCQTQRINYLQKTQNDLRQALVIYQKYGIRHPNNPQEKDSFKDELSRIHLYKLLGQLNFKQDDYKTSVDQFNKGLKLIEQVQSKTQKPLKQKGELLSGRGTSQSFEGNSEDAVKDYEQALKTYTKIYGSNNNAPSAIAIGNLGRVYMNQGQQQKAKACLSFSQKILKQVNGQQDPDYLHFKRVQKNFQQYRASQTE